MLGYIRAVSWWHQTVSELHRLTYLPCSVEAYRSQLAACDDAKNAAETARLELEAHSAEHMC